MATNQRLARREAMDKVLELLDIVNDLKWFVVYVVVGTVMATFAFPVLAGLG